MADLLLMFTGKFTVLLTIFFPDKTAGCSSGWLLFHAMTPLDQVKLKCLWFFCRSFQKVSGAPIVKCIFYYRE
ncbi:hypothetical protein DPU24_24055 [Salmonella enterica subsp. enterica serovar Oranienburg]|nr:hypothetical protein [Salmonella enterica subsp. enterica serovar Oranienburg]